MCTCRETKAHSNVKVLTLTPHLVKITLHLTYFELEPLNLFVIRDNILDERLRLSAAWPITRLRLNVTGTKIDLMCGMLEKITK